MPNYKPLEPTVEFWIWRDQAACIGHGTLFFNAENDTKGERRRKEQEAKAICAECPISATCRRFAMETGELYGVWGGMTEIERHKQAGRTRTG